MTTVIYHRLRIFVLAGMWFAGALSISAETLEGAFTPIPQGAEINLTAEGPLDWVHWGLVTESSIARKAGVAPQIPDFDPIGFNGPYRYSDNFNGYSWSDGTPTSSVTNTATGVWMYGKKDGFELNVRADTTAKTLKVYVGTFAAVGTFEARLGRKIYTDSSITNRSNGPGGVYVLTYSADSPDQILSIKYTVTQVYDSTGNVTLQAAALSAPDANNPPFVAITGPADSATFDAPATMTITAHATDFDGSITLVEFFEGTTKLGESTGSPYSMTWNDIPPGSYRLTARASDNGGATMSSAPVEIFVNGSGGSLSGSVALPPASVNLTTEGTSDWAHWGLHAPDSFYHKAGVIPQVSNFTKIGNSAVKQLQNSFPAFGWNDGILVVATNDTRNGVYVHGATNGFLLTVPADTSERTLRVYVGLYGAIGKFRATLSDFSAPTYTGTSLRSVYGNASGVYTLKYRAASSDQRLTVTYTTETLFDLDYGEIRLQAATLSGAPPPANSPPTAAITGPSEGALFASSADITITVDAFDSDGSISRVEFFQGFTKLGEATNSPYLLQWPVAPAGEYTLIATATDNRGATSTSNPVSITVTGAANVALTIVDPRPNGTEVNFSFATQGDVPYTVQFTDTLEPANWQTLEELVGDGSAKTVTDPVASGQQRFYRVKTQ